MIREYCDTFSVLVPYKARSAATMIALGADEIVMSDLSELSPIDPATANAFNRTDPKNPQKTYLSARLFEYYCAGPSR